jgi:hypothetical protein
LAGRGRQGRPSACAHPSSPGTTLALGKLRGSWSASRGSDSFRSLGGRRLESAGS